jgi:hypothetical protein
MAVGSAVSKLTFWGSKLEFELTLAMAIEEGCQADSSKLGWAARLVVFAVVAVSAD